jgi:hypothetical protein
MSIAIEQRPYTPIEAYPTATSGTAEDAYRTSDAPEADSSLRGGRLVSKLIAERRSGRGSEGHDLRIARLAKALSQYEGTLPDPANHAKRLRVTRLIATIDQGGFPLMRDRTTPGDEYNRQQRRVAAERETRQFIINSAPVRIDDIHTNGTNGHSKNGTNGHSPASFIPVAHPSRILAGNRL